MARSAPSCAATARGNPGLHVGLAHLALESPSLAQAGLEAVERYHTSGERPRASATAPVLAAFFNHLGLTAYPKALTKPEAQQMRVARLFECPLPASLLAVAGRAAGVPRPEAAIERLMGLGLLDRLADDGAPMPLFVAASLAKPLFGRLTLAEARNVADAVVRPLAEAWRGRRLPNKQAALEIARLAGIAGNAWEVGAEAALAAGQRLLDVERAAERALQVAQRALKGCAEAGVRPPPDLFRLAADCAERLVLFREQEWWLKKGVEGGNRDERTWAIFRLQQARRNFDAGRMDAAESGAAAAIAAFAALGEERLLAIARATRADVLQRRGQSEEARRILQEEVVPALKRIDEPRDLAIAYGRIATIHDERREFGEALGLLRDAVLPFHLARGETLSTALVWDRIAGIHMQRGDLEGALNLLRDKALPAAIRAGVPRATAEIQEHAALLLQNLGRDAEARALLSERMTTLHRATRGAQESTVAFLGLLASLTRADRSGHR